MIDFLISSNQNIARQIKRERQRLRLMGIHEERARRKGCHFIAGVDEAGRGPLAGPLVASAVLFENHPMLLGLADSKLLKDEDRQILSEAIRRKALAFSISEVSVQEMGALGMHRAVQLAMERAVRGLCVEPDWILLDGPHAVLALGKRQQAIVRGDRTSFSIAAASILAKVERDRKMCETDLLYPVYGFRRHKGYGTPEHLRALKEYGPCPVHRLFFKPVAQFMAVQRSSFCKEEIYGSPK